MFSSFRTASGQHRMINFNQGSFVDHGCNGQLTVGEVASGRRPHRRPLHEDGDQVRRTTGASAGSAFRCSGGWPSSPPLATSPDPRQDQDALAKLPEPHADESGWACRPLAQAARRGDRRSPAARDGLEKHRVRLLEPPEVLDHQSERHSRSPGAGSAPALRATETHRLTPSPAASDRGGTPDSRGLTRGGRFQRTRGATSVPNSSIERSTCSCGSVPTLMWSMNRSRPRCSL